MVQTLDQLVRSYLVESNQPESKYFRFLEIAINGFREMNLDFAGQPTTKILTLSDINTVDLPKDYIQYMRIAICGTDGKLHDLGKNENICGHFEKDDCGNESTEIPANTTPSSDDFISSVEGYADNWRNGELMGRMFGLGGGNNANGYYKIDVANGRIIFWSLRSATADSPQIVLEYLADPTLADADFAVHPYLTQAIKSYIYWKSIQRDRNQQLGRIQLAEADYWKTFFQARSRFNSATLKEWLEALRKSNKSSVKF